MKITLSWISTLVLVWLMLTPGAWALTPDEVLVIANKNAAKSPGLAAYYMEKRRIPKKNLVLLWMTDKETCTWSEYETKAIPPIRRFLENNPNIRAMVTMFGVPLRIAGPKNSDLEIKNLVQLSQKQKAIQEQLNSTASLEASERVKLQGSLARVNKEITSFKRGLDRTASFDSELSLVKQKDYELKMWQPNPFYLGFKGQTPSIPKSNVMMTSRLDAASPEIVKRIINDSIEAEVEGLKGTAYFDARWKDTGDKKVSGYAFYDQSIHKTARFHSEKKILPVVLNDTSDLFGPGDCPDAALYCGWYSLARYIDAFQWAKGSVGFHIASSECATLKGETSQVWCKKMLDNGIAATIGPVGEPYVQAFPVPEIFFNLLTEGYLTLAESYLVSLPFLSWKMVLIGDPLYRLNLKP
jgi:uncharacterized protein (TIGR03790 family)